MAQRLVSAVPDGFIQRVGVLNLAIKTVACGVMIFVCVRKLDVSIPAGKSFNARRFTRSGGGELCCSSFRVSPATVGFHLSTPSISGPLQRTYRYKYRHGRDVPE